jgi:hypothetical protein
LASRTASIARGTLPLAIFGPERYPIWVGRLAGPTLVAGAVSPALDKAGASVTLYVLEGFALVNIGIELVLWLATTRHTLQC